jgi:hypothetical protein
VIGGVGKALLDIRSDVFHFNPNHGVLEQKRPLIHKREGPIALYRKGYVYALGGKFEMSSCEALNVEANSWSEIADMNHGRYNASACLFRNEEFIYMTGGYPMDRVGRSLEKYSFEENIWTVIDIPVPA